MFSSQLIRILQTFPTNENNEICDFDTDEVKDNNTMKESPKRYTNPFLSDEENEKVNSWNNQELYTDKKVMEECELPELLVCYKEGSFHVKDICVDDGIPHGEKILFNEENHDDIINGSLDSQFLKPEELKFTPIEDFYKESNHQMDIEDDLDEGIERNLEIQVKDSQNLIPVKDCEDVESVCKDDDENSEFAPEKLKVSEESDTVPKGIDSYVLEEQINLSDNEEIVTNNLSPLQPLPSLKSLLESIHGAQSPVEETLNMPKEGNEGEEVGTSVQTTNNSNESVEETNNGETVINDVLHGLQSPENAHEHNVIISNPVQRGEGESSFSVANPVSGLITYSGQIAFSGSVSLRSDSSTTSTRSFAFPILQTEWNSSPVRMAKADRRRLQKQRGWRNGILCCRF